MKPPARYRLALWLVTTGLTQEEAGERFGCHQATVSKIVLGHRRPGLRIALAIERVTSKWVEGAIAMKEWLPEAAREHLEALAARQARA